MFRIVRSLIRVTRERLQLRRYDDFTIAEYFRKQGAQVGENNRLLIRSLGPEPYLIKIGNHCTISTNVTLLTHDGAAWVFTEELPSLQHFGPVEIRDNCFIGAGATILPGVKIGPNSIVGTCAVVTKDVPPDTVVAGCPARKICDLEEYRRKVVAAWQTQRPPGYMAELQDGARYSPDIIFAHKQTHSHLLRRHLSSLFWNTKDATP
jgi:hypothetical protein